MRRIHCSWRCRKKTRARRREAPKERARVDERGGSNQLSLSITLKFCLGPRSPGDYRLCSNPDILFPSQALKGAEMADKKKPTPKLDELEKGPWPSFVKEMKLSTETNAAPQARPAIPDPSTAERLVH